MFPLKMFYKQLIATGFIPIILNVFETFSIKCFDNFLSDFSHSIQKLKNCLNNIQNFMFANKLKLNPDKIEFILIGSQKIVTNSLTSLSIFWEIRSRQHIVSGTSEWCLTLISISQTTCHRSLRPEYISAVSECFGEQQAGLLQFTLFIAH